MRIAIIDLGTNSVRFDIHQVGPKKVTLLYREKVMVRLGQDVFTKGQLNPDAIHRTAHAFSAFKRISEEFSVNRIVALGTSALREAVDSSKLVSQIKSTTGIDVRVISGAEEAKLIALGILSHEKLPKKPVVLIDIGGGSTEISVVQKQKMIVFESLPLGTARLQQVFLKRSPPHSESIEELRHYIRKTLSDQLNNRKWPKTSDAIGSSGTIRALAKILKKMTGKKHLLLGDLRDLIKKMSRMNTTQLLGLPGLEAKRVDMILAGAILFEECLDAIGVEQIIPTEFSLRDGILKEQTEIAKKHMQSSIGLHLSDIIEKSKKLGGDETALRATLENSRLLFQKLRSVHRLKVSWKLYLEASVLLRNIGEAISFVGHPEHSYYIVKNTKFPFIEEWESELVAQLCRFHETHRIETKTLPFSKTRRIRQIFLKLLGLLCVVDALDVSPHSPAVIKRITVSNQSVKILVSQGSSSDLEVFRADSRKILFEQIFGKKLVVLRS